MTRLRIGAMTRRRRRVSSGMVDQLKGRSLQSKKVKMRWMFSREAEVLPESPSPRVPESPCPRVPMSP